MQPTTAMPMSETDLLYGPLNFDPAKATGRNPFGVHGGADTASVRPDERVAIVANAKGAHALLTPTGPLFWGFGLAFGVFLLNAHVRK